MRWSIIRLIWLRELRDQLRDRRTLFMVVVLPVLIYPLLGVGVLGVARGFGKKPSVVGLYGANHLPPANDLAAGTDPLPAVAWLSLAAPAPEGPGGGAARVTAAAALAQVAALVRGQDYPPLLQPHDDALRFPPTYFETPDETDLLQVQALPWPEGVPPVPAAGEDRGTWLKGFGTPLRNGAVSLLLVVPGDFRERLTRGQHPELQVLVNDEDERSRLVGTRVHAVLGHWNKRLAQVRLLRHRLPADYDEAFAVRDDPEQTKAPQGQAADRLSEALVRIFPFLLVMWSLTGALYPAVDLCAGEKERGTMETLLISPVSREEIVYGKFLTIWVFSGTTALLNLLGMGATTVLFRGYLPVALLGPAALLWCVLLVLPLSAFFSALCLAVGAYARSSKEGQYYLMPLFLVTMPLIFLTLTGVKLNAFYSMVPVTGVALLLQRLLTASTLQDVPWLYFGPVLAPTLLYGWLALRWAVSQFQREEVLFREAERLEVGLWLGRLFREKDPLPSAGQALFCFAVILGLRWLSLGLGAGWPLLLHAAIDLVAFVVTPPLLTALLLTTRPRYGLGLRRPPLQALLSAGVLVLLLVLPLADLGSYLLESFPELKKLLTETTPLAELMEAVQRGEAAPGSAWQLPLVLVLLAPVCEELAFRGFILTGLRQHFHPGTAILLSSFLFAVSHLNVFQFLPTFILGVILGVVATRSRSVLPGMLIHLVYNGLVVAPVVFPQFADALSGVLASPPFLRPALVALCSVLVAVYLAVTGYRLWATGRSPWWDEIAPPQPAPAAASANGAVAPGRPADQGAVT